MNMGHLKKTFFLSSKFVLGVVLMIYIINKNHLKFYELFSMHSSFLIFLLLTFQLAIFFLSTYRWMYLNNILNSVIIKYKEACLYAWVGLFFGNLLPAYISTDMVKYHYAKKTNKLFDKNAAIPIALDKLIVFSTMIVICMASLMYLFFQIKYSSYLLAGIISTGIILYLFRNNIRNILLKLPPWISIRNLFRPFLISFITLNLKIFSLVTVYLFFHTEISLKLYCLTWLGMFFEMIPLTPGGMGIGHFAFDLFYNQLSINNGIIIYNIYFMSKIIFKSTGLIGWLYVRKKM